MNDAEVSPPVATVLGWKCCGDIPLSPTSGERERRWAGLGYVGKDDTGPRFDLALKTRESGEALLSLTIATPDGRAFEQTAAATASLTTPEFGVPPLSFSFDIGDLFGPAENAEEGSGSIPRSRLAVLVSGHAALKARFRNSAFGLSYFPVVWDRWFFRENPPPLPAPRRILEWGPGRSTIFFAELFPGAEIDGVEHDARWFEHCRALEATFPGRVRMHHRRLAIRPASAEAYVTWPFYEAPETRYDLIFIDGRLRADCAGVARHILAEEGTVLIHDAHREVYRPVFGLFPESEIVYNTGVLGMKK